MSIMQIQLILLSVQIALLFNLGQCLTEAQVQDSQLIDSIFANADKNITQNSNEQQFRSMFSSSPGNEFINAEDTAASALSEIDHLRSIVISSDSDVSSSFNANGEATVPLATLIPNRVRSSSSIGDAGALGFESIFRSGASINNGIGSRRTPCVYDLAQKTDCDSDFREPTGRCTSLISDRKTWGMGGTPYTRVLPQAYEDGIGEMRRTAFSSRQPLKSAREISTLVTSNRVLLDRDGFNAQIMQWGQFISHEFTQLAESAGNASCCPDQIFRSTPGKHTKPSLQQLEAIREEIRKRRGDVCAQVEQENDVVYGGYVCMSQTRSRPAPLHDCTPGPRQQMNAITHVFDASAVYGSSLSEQRSLRSLSDGQMRIHREGNFLLPPQDSGRCPAAKRAVNKCPFKGGDSRINTTPNLIATHTAFLIKHNEIATKLSQLNHHWNDERIFQETRRIISAIQTSIHYYEYLPIIFGHDIIQKYRLSSYAGFDEDVNPSVLNELAGAAMRFGHSTVDGIYTVLRDDGSVDRPDLKVNFHNEAAVYENGIKAFIQGLLIDKPWDSDNKFPSQMRDALFNQKRDIVALNINRGRDHGFQSYVEYRRHYGLDVPLSFNHLRRLRTHSNEVVDRLKRAYSRVGDMELYIAGVTEIPMPGAFVGELFANILGDGFSRLLQGDRLHFESSQSGLNQDQIQAIRGYKYNQLLCESAEIPEIVENAFRRSSHVNIIKCNQLTPLNLNLWKESLKPIIEPVQCKWKITDMTNCCRGLGRRVTTRVCEGGANCKCSGPTKISTPCTCRGRVCSRAAIRRKCRAIWARLNISP